MGARWGSKKWLLPTFFILVLALLFTWQLISTPALAVPSQTAANGPQEISALTLVNADTDQDIRVLVNNDVLNLATLPTQNLNIRADVSAPVGSVRFALDGNDNYRTESIAPYALAGDDNGDYQSWTPSVGSHILTATPYDEVGGGGTAGAPVTINFTVIDEVGTPLPTRLAFMAVVLNGFGSTPTPISPTNTPTSPTATPTSTPLATNTPVTGCGGAQFEEDGGLIVMEIESQPVAGDWVQESSIGGYTGSGYYRWNGDNLFGKQGEGLLEYKIKVNTTGTYRFIWRSNNTIGKSGEHNDAWLKFPDVPAEDFYAVRDSSVIYPIGSGLTPNPEGAGGNGWFKIFMSEPDEWSWQAMTSDGNAHNIFVDFDSPGVYTMQISGRSSDFALDRAVLYNESLVSGKDAKLTSNPETLCPAP